MCLSIYPFATFFVPPSPSDLTLMRCKTTVILTPLPTLQSDQFCEADHSLLQRLGSTNVLPGPVETQTLRKIRDIAKEDMNILEVCLAEIQVLEKQVREKYEKVVYIRDCTTKGLSSSRWLPPEVVLEVAEHCIDHTRPTDTTGALWVMGQVCTMWRKAVLGAPWLWTDVFVDLSSASDSEKDPVILETWLERSRELALNVRVRTVKSPQQDVPSNEVVNRIVGVLAGHSERWYRAHFNLELTFFHWARFSRIEGKIPKLQMLQLDGYCGVTDAFQYAPELWSVSLGFHSSFELFKLPWSEEKITHLTIDALSLERAGLSHLERFPHLIELTINESDSIKSLDLPPFRSELSLRRINLLRLKRLGLSFSTYRDLKDAIIKRLILPPTLEHARIHNLAFLKGMMPLSHCRISSLTIDDPYIFSLGIPQSVKDVIATLRSFPHLAALSINGLHDHGDSMVLVEELTIIQHDSATHFLPRLKTLQLSVGDGVDAYPEDVCYLLEFETRSTPIFNMLNSRWHFPSGTDGVDRLEHFRYAMNIHEDRVPAPDADVMTVFDVLREQGMGVEIEFRKFREHSNPWLSSGLEFRLIKTTQPVF
ncbi:hypothetical protein VKT23_000419 [Stygiomarasmius scandens]|uniref:F-box domain-containing protein n=1 Tax=Marasmiellus scandens TaxID=2682957 RepID=A0ABR1K491_9AGAR